MIVLDTSVLVNHLLTGPAADTAIEKALAGSDEEPFHAPELIEPETLAALRGMVARGAVSDQRAGQAVLDLDRVRLVRHPQAGLRARVWELRHELTAYDASYLALAEALPAVLLTADAGLATRAERSLGREGVRRVR